MPRPVNVLPRENGRDSFENRAESGKNRNPWGSSKDSSISRIVGASFGLNGGSDQSKSISCPHNVYTWAIQPSQLHFRHWYISAVAAVCDRRSCGKRRSYSRRG